MSENDIISAIDAAVEKTQHTGCVHTESLGELPALITASGNYDEFDNHVHMLGNSGECFTHAEFAQRLVQRAVSVGAATTLHEVHAYISAEDVHLQRVLLLHDIHINNEFDFANGVRLVNVQNLPHSVLRDALTHHQFGSFVGGSIDAVLVTDFVHKKSTWHADEARPDSLIMDEQTAKTKLLDDTRLILSLARPHEYGIPVVAATTLVPAHLSFLSRDLCYNRYPEPHTAFGPPILNIEMQLADRLLGSLQALDEVYRDRILIPLKRLNDTKMDPDWADKAINLRICLENIFLNPGETTQIARRLSNRAPEHTTFSKTRVRKVYGFLSQSVHSGKPQTHPEINELMIAQEVQNVLRQFIENGGYPTWPELNFTQRKRVVRWLKRAFSWTK